MQSPFCLSGSNIVGGTPSILLKRTLSKIIFIKMSKFLEHRLFGISPDGSFFPPYTTKAISIGLSLIHCYFQKLLTMHLRLSQRFHNTARDHESGCIFLYEGNQILKIDAEYSYVSQYTMSSCVRFLLH